MNYKSVSVPLFFKERICSTFATNTMPAMDTAYAPYQEGLLDVFKQKLVASKFFEINNPILKAASGLMFYPMGDIHDHCLLRGNDRWGFTQSDATYSTRVTFKIKGDGAEFEHDVPGFPAEWADEFGWGSTSNQPIDTPRTPLRSRLGSALFGTKEPNLTSVFGFGKRTILIREPDAPEAYATLRALLDECIERKREHNEAVVDVRRHVFGKNTTKQILDERPELIDYFPEDLLRRMRNGR